MSQPTADIRLLERLEAHLASPEMLGVGVGEGRDVVEFLARLSMADVEALLPEGLNDKDRRTILGLVEHRKGQLQDHELPDSEAHRRAQLLEDMRRRVKQRRKG